MEQKHRKNREERAGIRILCPRASSLALHQKARRAKRLAERRDRSCDQQQEVKCNTRKKETDLPARDTTGDTRTRTALLPGIWFTEHTLCRLDSTVLYSRTPVPHPVHPCITRIREAPGRHGSIHRSPPYTCSHSSGTSHRPPDPIPCPIFLPSCPTADHRPFLLIEKQAGSVCLPQKAKIKQRHLLLPLMSKTSACREPL